MIKSARSRGAGLAVVFILTIFLLSMAAPGAHANSAKPPDLVVIMKNAPNDVSLRLDHPERGSEIQKFQRFWETYFVVDLDGYLVSPGQEPPYLTVSGGGESFTIQVDDNLFTRFETIVTLDFKTRELTPGELPGRSISLVALRVVLTLLIEGAVLFSFGYREKRSWLVFLCTNIVTQGYLNLKINMMTVHRSYSFFSLIFMEIIILIVEIIAFRSLFREHSKSRAASFATVANFLSLILGWIFLTFFPL